jgi:hypothetical protein
MAPKIPNEFFMLDETDKTHLRLVYSRPEQPEHSEHNETSAKDNEIDKQTLKTGFQALTLELLSAMPDATLLVKNRKWSDLKAKMDLCFDRQTVADIIHYQMLAAMNAKLQQNGLETLEF